MSRSRTPLTIVGELGTAKRNILRRSTRTPVRKEKVPGMKVDDGSLDDDDVFDSFDDIGESPDAELEEEEDEHQRELFFRGDVARAPSTLSQFKAAVDPLLRDFFRSGDGQELAMGLHQLPMDAYGYEMVKRIINQSLDQGEAQREQVSRFLSDAYPYLLNMAAIQKGFEKLLEIHDEILLDAPQAKEMLAAFLARAVVDEILPPSFLSNPYITNLGGEVVAHARVLLSRDHASVRLEKIWGPGDGRPVEELKRVIDETLSDFFVGGDFQECIHTLREMQTPYFYHEVVKRGLVMSMERSEADRESILRLFNEINRMNLASSRQIIKGFERVSEILNDLQLDIPNAPTLFRELMDNSKNRGLLDQSFKITHIEDLENTGKQNTAA